MRRRALLAGALALPLAGCTTTEEDPTAKLWHAGELTIGTGNTTGVFYQLGAAYADLINQHLAGFDATAAPSGGSVDNLQRLGTGDVDVAFTLAVVADDAYQGINLWASQPQPLRALAHTYDNYEHVIVRVDSGITTVAGLKGHKISLGSPNSGSDLLGRRLLSAAGLDPARDVTVVSMSLPQTTAAILDGSIHAMIWSGGLPTPGIKNMFQKADGAVQFVKIQDMPDKINEAYPNLLGKSTIPKDAYGLTADVPTLTDANLIVVHADMPDDLAYQLTKLVFDFHGELVQVTPAAAAIRRDLGPMTEPVPLHPGAQRFYGAR
jgi:TRAP transporter solute receptor, TAXI family